MFRDIEEHGKDMIEEAEEVEMYQEGDLFGRTPEDLFAQATDGRTSRSKSESDDEMRRLTASQVCKMLMRVTADIAEMYSPARVAEEGKRWGLKPGESMDLLTGWDFDRPEHKKAAKEYVERVKPRLVIGSPMCRMFSSLQNLNPKKGSLEWEEEYQKLRNMLNL